MAVLIFDYVFEYFLRVQIYCSWHSFFLTFSKMLKKFQFLYIRSEHNLKILDRFIYYIVEQKSDL